MKTASQLRELFLAFFERHAHRRVVSHSLIPPADPTLLFVNAGMVQFKDVFVGVKQTDFSRATSAQKCLRVSGKHNDLENVGRTARHHTFFEMMGNFSFGDYFKRDAIQFAYDFLIKDVGLPADKMYYTVFGGDEADGLDADEEAIGYWLDVAGVAPDRVLKFGKKDNFWAMGEVGPCGPCSEILVDRGPGPWACGEPSCAPGCDCDRYVEVWNLVFMQYERKTPGGELTSLPAPSIDTGLGLERLAALVQGTPSNYETDLFMPLITLCRELYTEETGKEVSYGAGGENDVAMRVIADHARAAAFLVADGVYPDNEGRGYVTRLLIRRAVRFGRKMGFSQPFFFKVCDRVVDMMLEAYPDLAGRRGIIEKVIAREEDSFTQTFDDGRKVLEDEMERLTGQGKSVLEGAFLFKLHDERGFQPDLVEVIAAEQGFRVDRSGYDQLMEEKRQASGKAKEEGSGGFEEIVADLVREVGSVDFSGYEGLEDSGAVLAILAEGRRVEELAAGAEGVVVLDRTPFYGEAGGQVGDTGTLKWPRGEAQVTTTGKAAGDINLHYVKVQNGTLTVGQKLTAAVDGARRAGICAHHSGTHLLHHALEQILGQHIKQEGSMVKDDLLRFDFRHFSPLTMEEIERIEALVAEKVLENSQVDTSSMSIEEATATGAKAFFDEKYGDKVRLVSMGEGVSRELCGGTHASRTGEVGLCKITKQEAVSAGVRRLYAVCHKAAVRHVAGRDARFRGLAALLKATPEDLEARLRKLVDRADALDKEVKELNRKLMEGAGQAAADGWAEEEVGGLKIAYANVGEGDDAKIRTMADMLRDKLGEGVVLVGGVKQGKLVVVAAGTRGRPDGFHCGQAIRLVAEAVGGRGGGKPDFGQAGGGDPERWDNAVERFLEFARESMSG